ncbi:MAG: UvrB/UvrC motif-containing protein [Spirochaetales bacterium]|nr:UvrB/UvrC motif-containing protein [Spirochaetales bacterium]
MTCEICNAKEAVFHIKQIIGKDEIELHLCDKCAQLRGITKSENAMDFSISQLLTGLVDTKTVIKKNANEIQECAQCGYTLTKFKKTGVLGCSECFAVFAKQVKNYVHKIYGNVAHRGKYPSKLEAYKNYVFDVETLKEELKQAITVEDYERAALLRDRIRDMTDEVEENGE